MTAPARPAHSGWKARRPGNDGGGAQALAIDDDDEHDDDSEPEDEGCDEADELDRRDDPLLDERRLIEPRDEDGDDDCDIDCELGTVDDNQLWGADFGVLN